MKASTAYSRNLDGTGVTIAILDSGIAQNSPEFAGRLSDKGTTFEQGFARCGTCVGEKVRYGIEDVRGHGTAVASIAAAAKNDVGIAGVAPKATIMALNISGVDFSKPFGPGELPGQSDGPSPLVVPKAINHAVENGAFVINLSSNISGSPMFSADRKAAMDNVRTNNRLLVQSLTNFVGDDSFTGKDTQEMRGADLQNAEWFLYAGTVNSSLVSRGANTGNAGPIANRQLMAVGDDVTVLNLDGTYGIVTGTSFAAPAIAGAAALLKQAWPQLGGKEISKILLDSARDLGAPGVDAIYGAGLLDLDRALTLQNPLLGSTAAGAVAVAGSTVTTSGAFGSGGSGFAQVLSKTTAIDSYGRDWTLNLSGLVGRQGAGIAISNLVGIQPTAAQFTNAFNTRMGIVDNGMLSNDNNRPAVPPAAFSFAVSKNATVNITAGAGLGGSSPTASLRNIESAQRGSSVRLDTADFSFGMTSGNMNTRDGRSARLARVSFAHHSGVGFSVARLNERGQALGLIGTGAFAIDSASTMLAEVSYAHNVGPVRLTAIGTYGNTRANSSQLLKFDAPITSSAYRFEAATGFAGGMLNLAVGSPLRVNSAKASVQLASAYNFATNDLAGAVTALDFKATARETDLEASWSTAFGPNVISFGAAYANNVGHVARQCSTAAWARFYQAF